MIRGVHLIQFADDARAARAFFRDVLGWDHVDAGEGWLIFGLPPSELGVHPTDGEPPPGQLAFYLICDDVEQTVSELRSRGVEFTSGIVDARFGRTISLRVPGAGEIGLYQPAHPLAIEA